MADMFEMVEKMRAGHAAQPPPARTPWRSVGERAMVRGVFTIAKYGNPPNVDYGLFGEGPAMLAHDPDYRVLMDLADKLEKGKAG